jgi:hypothetical protein
MLVAELDFKMKDVLTVALEPEVPGLDHARMHWSDADFMNLLTSDRVERIRFAASPPGRADSNRAQPRVPLGFNAGLLVKLALKIVHARNPV